MKKFKYLVFDNKKNQKKEGSLDSVDRNSAVSALQAEGYMVLHITEDDGLSINKLNQINLTGISQKEKVLFIRQLATMISAGLPLVQGLYILQGQSKGQLASIIGDLIKSVEGGQTFGDALALHPDFLSHVQISLVRAGERSGKFDIILSNMADDAEKSAATASKIRGAMIYPAVILCAAVGVVIMVLTTLIPTISALYDSFGNASLPWETESLVVLSNLVLTKWWLLIAILVIIIVAFRYYKNTPDGKLMLARIILLIPIVNKIVTGSNIVRFTRTMSLLVSSGIPILDALDMTAQSMSNVVFINAVTHFKDKVERGIPLSFTISEVPLFPPMLSKMISIGESTGKMDELLSKTAQYFDNELNNLVNNLTKIMEPITLFVMGGIVGYIAVAIYLPIYSLGSVIH